MGFEMLNWEEGPFNQVFDLIQVILYSLYSGKTRHELVLVIGNVEV